MRQLLIHLFVKDASNIEDKKVRYAYGQLGSGVGIICNILLVILKLIVGFTVNAISVISDGINNLSDCASCIMNLVGNYLSIKPADKEHPFGHGRMEYVGSLAVGIVVLLAGWELLQESVSRIMDPDPVSFSYLSIGLLVFSILVKLWMFTFDNYIGKLINHVGIKAAAKDSLNDVFTSLVTIFALFSTKWLPNVPMDGIIGVIVSLVVFKEGVDIVREVVNQLLGKPVDLKLAHHMEKIIRDNPNVLGVHDIIVHEYGHGTYYASAHVELNADMDFKAAHEVVTDVEEEVREQLGVRLITHSDPVDRDNPIWVKYHDQMKEILKEIDSSISGHDLQLRNKDNVMELSFDVLIPYSCTKKQEDIQKELQDIYHQRDPEVKLVVEYDRDYISDEEEDEDQEGMII